VRSCSRYVGVVVLFILGVEVSGAARQWSGRRPTCGGAPTSPCSPVPDALLYPPLSHHGGGGGGFSTTQSGKEGRCAFAVDAVLLDCSWLIYLLLSVRCVAWCTQCGGTGGAWRFKRAA
jgi:hypothetical protein